MPSPPVILSAVMSPNVMATGEPVTVLTTWTGDPKTGVSHQWRQSTARIRGATAPTYTPTGAEVALNCMVTIDNGYGTAIANAIFTTTVPVDDDEVEGGDFSSDFSSDFSGGE
jgi:hypothetical protein